MKDLVRAFVAAAVAAIALTGTANANTIVNGGFEVGDLTGWSSVGSGSVVTAGYGTATAGGTYHGLLNSSGGVATAGLESFLGLSAGAIDTAFGFAATQGSTFGQLVTGIKAGDQLTFRFNFLTDESISDPAPDSLYNDTAFLSLVNMTSGQVELERVADYNSAVLTASGTPYFSETGYLTFTYTFTGAGDFFIGFGIVDVFDTNFGSGLLIDDISLITVIPLPAPVWMGLTGLAGMVLLRRRSAAA